MIHMIEVGLYRDKDKIEVIKVEKDKVIVRDPKHKLDIWPIKKTVFNDIYEKVEEN